MKRLRGWIYLGSFCAAALWIEYQLALLLGAGWVLCGSVFALAVLTFALWRAPEGQERADGLHIRSRKGSSGFVPAVGAPARRMRRGWT